METISEERTLDLESTAKPRRLMDSCKRLEGSAVRRKKKEHSACKESQKKGSLEKRGCNDDKCKELKKKYEDLK